MMIPTDFQVRILNPFLLIVHDDTHRLSGEDTLTLSYIVHDDTHRLSGEDT